MPAGKVSGSGELMKLESEDSVAVFAKIPLEENIAKISREIYENLFRAIGRNHLYRIWNYLPGINNSPGSMEIYRQFNIGRWLAFENTFGPRHEIHMPAASAVGAKGDELVILAVAGSQLPRYLENPHQVPAYQYPAEHGPRAPGFSRATVLPTQGGKLAYLSGTASILGHQTVGSGDLELQFKTTMDNVSTMLQRMGDFSVENLAPGSPLKCYLRHGVDLERISELFRASAKLDPEKEILFLEAEICRGELDLEIEGIFFTPAQVS